MYQSDQQREEAKKSRAEQLKKWREYNQSVLVNVPEKQPVSLPLPPFPHSPLVTLLLLLLHIIFKSDTELKWPNPESNLNF